MAVGSINCEAPLGGARHRRSTRAPASRGCGPWAPPRWRRQPWPCCGAVPWPSEPPGRCPLGRQVPCKCARVEWFRKVKRISGDRAVFDVTVKKPMGLVLEYLPDKKGVAIEP